MTRSERIEILAVVLINVPSPLGCYVMSTGKQLLTFQRRVAPPSSGSSSPKTVLVLDGITSLKIRIFRPDSILHSEHISHSNQFEQ